MTEFLPSEVGSADCIYVSFSDAAMKLLHFQGFEDQSFALKGLLTTSPYEMSPTGSVSPRINSSSVQNSAQEILRTLIHMKLLGSMAETAWD